jgi:murein DD-endopeptidase MepM/ murein hydrolase activator NlpD|tara:strand:- start:374 stop:1042 length:669 start_codon:yes stop_codon:yes gene_type:complete
MRWPIDKVHITQEFGENPSIYKRFGLAGHNGIDFRTRFIDTPRARRYVTAALAGKVINVGDQGRKGYGKFIRLQHKGLSQTVYAHLTRFYVEKGDQVREGDRIGLSGNTGFSTGPHLHFGYRPEEWKGLYENGFKGYVDPLPYLRGEKTKKKEIPNPGFAKKWAGWLLIVPELGGEVWYVNPLTLKRYRLSGGVSSKDAALLARDKAWVGMSFRDISKIPEA